MRLPSRAMSLSVIWAICLAAAGCSKQEVYPVQGKVVFADGQPATELSGGFVALNSIERAAGARGVIQSDGSFQLTTIEPGDGAYLGKHQVQVNPPHFLREDETRTVHKITLDRRYMRFDTSELELNVEPKNNDVVITVDRQKK